MHVWFAPLQNSHHGSFKWYPTIIQTVSCWQVVSCSDDNNHHPCQFSSPGACDSLTGMLKKDAHGEKKFPAYWRTYSTMDSTQFSTYSTLKFTHDTGTIIQYTGKIMRSRRRDTSKRYCTISTAVSTVCILIVCRTVFSFLASGQASFGYCYSKIVLRTR